MKCKNCKHDMERVKVNDNEYIYKCSNCGKELGNPVEKEVKEDAKDKELNN